MRPGPLKNSVEWGISASTPATLVDGSTQLMEAPIKSTRQNITIHTRWRILGGSEPPFVNSIVPTPSHESHSLVWSKPNALVLPKTLLRIVSHQRKIICFGILVWEVVLGPP